MSVLFRFAAWVPAPTIYGETFGVGRPCNREEHAQEANDVLVDEIGTFGSLAVTYGEPH